MASRRKVEVEGVEYVTSSARRYVLFRHHPAHGPYIVKRSDNLGFLRAFKHQTDIIIDFVEGTAV